MAARYDGVSDGSDIEVDRGGEEDFLADLNGDNEIIQLHDPDLEAELNDFVRNIIESDGEEEPEFHGFQNYWRTDAREFTWRRTRAYTRQRHLRQEVAPDAKAIDYFYLFWDENMWARIVNESNRYARQQREQNPPPPSFRNLALFTLTEVKTFVGLCLVMGVLRLLKQSDYWRTKESCWLANTKFGLAMSRNRFDAIWRYLHLQDNTETNPDGDKLFKLRKFLDILLTNFRDVFTPGPSYTVDESMIKFKGRLSIQQYMPIKPIKWGVKVWTLAESTTGYVVNFQIYTGRENRRTEHGLSYRVVVDMCRMLQGTQSQVYFDIFFTGSKLLLDLTMLQIQACGTVRANRKGLPADVIPGKGRPALRRHSYKVAQRDDLVFTHWQDTKPVCVLSNFHDPEAMGIVKRRVDGQRADVQVPACLADYQKHMKGVDLCDQMVGYYLLNHRSWKWWRRIFFHMLLVSVHNAYIVAKHHKGEAGAKRLWPSFQEFVEAVAHGLVTTVVSRSAPVHEAPIRATLEHKVEMIFQKKKVCLVCSRKAAPGARSRVTKFGCVLCEEGCHRECLNDHIRHHNVIAAAANAQPEVAADAVDDNYNPDSEDDEDIDNEA